MSSSCETGYVRRLWPIMLRYTRGIPLLHINILTCIMNICPFTDSVRVIRSCVGADQASHGFLSETM